MDRRGWKMGLAQARLFVRREKETMKAVAGAVVIGAIACVADRVSLLTPLVVVPLLAAARYGGNKALWAATFWTSICMTIVHRYPSIEAEVWGGTLTLGVLSVLALVIEAWWKPKREIPRNVAEQDLALVVDCDGLAGLEARYGQGAKDHVAKILARTLESETTAEDLVARTAEDEFVVVLHEGGRQEADAILDRVHARFSQAVADAGYECAISVGYAPFEPTYEGALDMVEPEHPLRVTVAEVGEYGAYLN